MKTILKKDKRGLSLGDLYPAVLAIVVIGIVLGIGIFILLETSKAVSTTSFTSVNETIVINAGGIAVANSSVCGFNTFAVVQMSMVNQTANGNIATGNYTENADNGIITNTSLEDYGTSWNLTYTSNQPTTGSLSCSSIVTTSTGVEGFATWIAVIVVVIAAAIVLGVVISSFGGSRAV